MEAKLRFQLSRELEEASRPRIGDDEEERGVVERAMEFLILRKQDLRAPAYGLRGCVEVFPRGIEKPMAAGDLDSGEDESGVDGVRDGDGVGSRSCDDGGAGWEGERVLRRRGLGGVRRDCGNDGGIEEVRCSVDSARIPRRVCSLLLHR